MKFIDEKIKVTIKTLQSIMYSDVVSGIKFEYAPCGYKSNNTLPDETLDWKSFANDKMISGSDAHYWFKTKFKTPPQNSNREEIYFELLTGMEGQWDATNPQCILYLNGKMVQGLDINHTEVQLDFDTEYDMHIYFYVGMHKNSVRFNGRLKLLDTKLEKLYYHLNVPFQAMQCLERDDDNYNKIIKHLEIACNFIDFRNIKSEAFYKSVDEAILYLEEEFYKKACGKK